MGFTKIPNGKFSKGARLFNSLDKMYDQDLVLSIDNQKLINVIKNRYGSTGRINNFSELMYFVFRLITDAEVRDDLNHRVFNDMFKQEMVKEMREAVNGVLERHNLEKI